MKAKSAKQAGSHPKGAGLGCPTKSNPFGVLYFEDCMAVGSRAQRRAAIRLIRQAAAKGDQEAAKALQLVGKLP